MRSRTGRSRYSVDRARGFEGDKMIEVRDMVRFTMALYDFSDVNPPRGTTGIVIEVDGVTCLVQWKRGTTGTLVSGVRGVNDIPDRWWVLTRSLEVVGGR